MGGTLSWLLGTEELIERIEDIVPNSDILKRQANIVDAHFKKFVLCSVVLGVASTCAIVYFRNMYIQSNVAVRREKKKEEKGSVDYWIMKAVGQLEKPCTVIQEPYYVVRPSLESELKSAVDSMCENASRTYYVIIGSRGTGKTFYITIILT